MAMPTILEGADLPNDVVCRLAVGVAALRQRVRRRGEALQRAPQPLHQRTHASIALFQDVKHCPTGNVTTSAMLHVAALQLRAHNADCK